ncbi:MAG TPA: hypothetical protein VGC60_14555 [Pyrinomonadaceae bacterium]
MTLTSGVHLGRYEIRAEIGAGGTALLYIGLGDKAHALSALEKACDDRYFLMIWINSDPRLDNLRSDQRFADLVHRVGV